LRPSGPSFGSLSLNYRHSEPPSFPSRASNLQDDSEATSIQVDHFAQPSTSRQHFSTSVEDSQSSNQLQPSGAAQLLKEPVLSESSRARRIDPNPPKSSDIPTSSKNDPQALARGTWSREAPHSLNQVQSHQPYHSVSDESHLQFQTPASIETRDKGESQIAYHHVQRYDLVLFAFILFSLKLSTSW
jgi:hypothetical protein